MAFMISTTMTPGSAELTNWSMTGQSRCTIFRPTEHAEIIQSLSAARTLGLSIIAHGAGHSYTDAALNTDGAVLDLTGMRRILAWDPERGIMTVEPGVTIHDVIRVAMPDGWWPPITPSTTEATIGGCVAMNVTGKNAWKSGSFGEHVQSLTVLLVSGQSLTLSPDASQELFQAFVGTAGLLGIITAITMQLRPITSGMLDVAIHPAASLGEMLSIFQREQAADLLEGLVDGFDQRGRGIVTCASYSDVHDPASLRFPGPPIAPRVTTGVARSAGMAARPIVRSGTRLANRALYRWATSRERGRVRRKPLFQNSFFSLAEFAGYHALLPRGIVSQHAFVPEQQAEATFKEILRASREQRFAPLWSVIKRHRADPFLLSYQVDGFSLENYYQVVPQKESALRAMVRELMAMVVAAGGRFYLAKDGLLTPDLYRRSIGDAAVEAFLRLKRQYDPEMRLQSDLFRRVFLPNELVEVTRCG